jgi:hypothetical protein
MNRNNYSLLRYSQLRVLMCLVGTALLAMVWPAAAQAAPVGEVDFTRGVAYAALPGKPARLLSKGQPIEQRDTINTTDGSFAIVRFTDGTRMTLRPNTTLAISNYRFEPAQPQTGTWLLSLVRGGVRAITGVVTKNSATAGQIRTSTATIGIRGTEFDARICGKDCGAESARLANRGATSSPNQPRAAAKAVFADGAVSVVAVDKTSRPLASGGPVFPGETVVTGVGAKALLILRDQGRMALGGNTRLTLEDFVYAASQPTESRLLARLGAGTLRFLTGLTAKPNMQIRTATATIGVRGTGLDIVCTGDCADSGSAAASQPGSMCINVWDGAIEVRPEGGGQAQAMDKGTSAELGKSGAFQRRQTMCPTDVERPDEAKIDFDRYFSTGDVADEEGLYIVVRDGHVQIVADGGATVDLAKGETGYTDGKRALRPSDVPPWISFDPTPLPNSSNPDLAPALQDAGVNTAPVCRP